MSVAGVGFASGGRWLCQGVREAAEATGAAGPVFSSSDTSAFWLRIFEGESENLKSIRPDFSTSAQRAFASSAARDVLAA
jgi:hypothetical protein